MNYAQVDGAGTVQNIALWDGVTEWTQPEGWTAVQSPSADGSQAEIGGTWDGAAFAAAVSPVVLPVDPPAS